jgi:origin recognition complex subunit 2
VCPQVRLRPASDASGELLTLPMSRADMRAVLEDLVAARAE